MKANSLYYRVADLPASQLHLKMTDEDKSILKSILRKALFFRTILGFLVAFLCYYLMHVLAVVLTFGKEDLFNYYIIIHLLTWVLLICGYGILNFKTIRLYEDLRLGFKEIVVERIASLLKSIHTVKKPNLIDNVHPVYNDIHFFYLKVESYWIQTDYLTFESAEPGASLKIHRGLRSGIVLRTDL